MAAVQPSGEEILPGVVHNPVFLHSPNPLSALNTSENNDTVPAVLPKKVPTKKLKKKAAQARRKVFRAQQMEGITHWPASLVRMGGPCARGWAPFFPVKDARRNLDYLGVSGFVTRQNMKRGGYHTGSNVDISAFPADGESVLRHACAREAKGKGMLRIPCGAAHANGETKMWDSCAVVGNGGHLLLSAYGESVDSHDVVMRMNQAPTRGYVDKVGRKTTHRLLNRLWTLAYTNDTEIRWPYRTKEVIQVERGVTLVSSRTSANNYDALRKYSLHRFPVAQVIKMHSATVSETQKALLNFAKCQAARVRVVPPSTMTPSSGLVAIVLLHNLCTKLTVYGVGPPHKSTTAQVPYQYYQLGRTERSKGNAVHAFDTEEAMFKSLSDSKVYTLCNELGCFYGHAKVKAPKYDGAQPPSRVPALQ